VCPEVANWPPLPGLEVPHPYSEPKPLVNLLFYVQALYPTTLIQHSGDAESAWKIVTIDCKCKLKTTLFIVPNKNNEKQKNPIETGVAMKSIQ
jgi:hypothetical protein